MFPTVTLTARLKSGSWNSQYLDRLRVGEFKYGETPELTWWYWSQAFRLSRFAPARRMITKVYAAVGGIKGRGVGRVAIA